MNLVFGGGGTRTDRTCVRRPTTRGEDQSVTTQTRMLQLVSLLVFCLPSTLQAQVDYGKDSPWDQRAESGPDAKVPGWFYNLGITGLRAQLVAALGITVEAPERNQPVTEAVAPTPPAPTPFVATVATP